MSQRDVADFWFDPLCPWAWMTSRWMLEVTQVRLVDVRWHLMSLSALNRGRDLPPDYQALMEKGWQPVRILAAARRLQGEEVLLPLYTAMGTRFHPGGREDWTEVFAESLAEVGLPAELIDAAQDAGLDALLEASTAEAVALVGDDVGTPVVAVNGVAFFGPVVTPAPRGELAARLWDGAVAVASVPGFYELKRSRTQGPIFD
ncbi:MAG: disulfide bond formation protein DsbA [Kineosporiaceae bacterium]